MYICIQPSLDACRRIEEAIEEPHPGLNGLVAPAIREYCKALLGHCGEHLTELIAASDGLLEVSCGLLNPTRGMPTMTIDFVPGSGHFSG